MSARARIVQVLTEKVGFPFNESELPPTIRQKIGELANLYEQIDNRASILAYRQQQVQTFATQDRTNTLIGLIVGGAVAIIGALGVGIAAGTPSTALVLLFAISFLAPGVIVLFYSILQWNTTGQPSKKVRATEDEIRTLKTDITRLDSTFDLQLTNLSQQIVSALSSIHESRMRPQAATQGPQVVRETIFKEVVMIQCPYCKGLMPQTSIDCPHCGARRRG